MVCRKPFVGRGTPFGCGQCMPCRIRKRRLWTHRLVLESLRHNISSMVTLTYDEGAIPAGGSLRKRDVQLWLKRIRKDIEPNKIRFYSVGEYGDETWRPHYHVAVFGQGCPNPFYCKDMRFRKKHLECCEWCVRVYTTWGKGTIEVDELNRVTAQYVVGYVTKKLTNKNCERVQKILGGRAPEFSTKSNRPGIGALSLDEIVEVLTTEHGCNEILRYGDVPLVLNHGKHALPLGRYLREKLREKLGFPEKSTPKEVLRAYQEEMRALQESVVYLPENKNKSWEEILVDMNLQKVLNVEGKHKIFRKRGSI